MAAFASSFALFLKEAVGGGEEEEEDGEGRRSMLVMVVVVMVLLVLWRQACKAACSLAVVYVCISCACEKGRGWKGGTEGQDVPIPTIKRPFRCS